MKKFLIAILGISCCLLVGCGKQEENENKDKGDVQNQTQTETQKELGSVDQMSVEVLASLFNDEINENSGLGALESDTPTTENGTYRYELEDGIYLTVTPVNNLSSKDKDIVQSMQICFGKDLKNDQRPATYARLLVVANNNEITNTEAETLVSDSLKDTANNGKGISVKYVEKNDHFEYQILRNNK